MNNLSTSCKTEQKEVLSGIFAKKSTIRIDGTQSGVHLSIPAKIYNLSGIEYFARVLCGNVSGNRDFALNQLKKIAKVNNAVIVFNGQVL